MLIKLTRKIILFYLIATFSIQCNQKFVIGNHGSGFFSIFLGALNNIAWCERNNRVPVIYWSRETLYYNYEGYNGAFNVWEYYFKPISELRYIQGDPIFYSYFPPDNQLVIPIQALPSQAQKEYIKNSILDKYITLNPIVEKKIDYFFEKNMKNKKNIGIHLRGTDKILEVSPIAIDKILYEAQQHATPDCQFFIATDEERLLNRAKEILGSQVIFYDSYRSPNGHPIHRRYRTKGELGEEVLIETYLLSKCDLFIHTLSNVSICALIFNPTLKNIFLSA